MDPKVSCVATKRIVACNRGIRGVFGNYTNTTPRPRRSQNVVRWSATCLGLFVTDGDFNKWRQRLPTHGTQSRSMLCVLFEIVVRRFTHIVPAGLKGRYLTDDYRSIVSLDSLGANREWSTLIRIFE